MEWTQEMVDQVRDGTHAIVDGRFVRLAARGGDGVLRFVNGWDLEKLCARAQRPDARPGPAEFGVLKAVLCCSPLHESRRGLDDGLDYRDVVQTFTGSIALTAARCNRCHHYDKLSADEQETEREAQAKQQSNEKRLARQALATRLGMSLAEVEALFR